MRATLPRVKTTDGMGISSYQNEDYNANALELYNLGYRKVRMGGTSPSFAALSNPTVVSAADIVAYKAKGFYVEKGCTHASGVDATLTSTNWADYHDYAVSLAQLWYAKGLDTFMIGNEMYTHVDGTTLTQDQLYSNFVQLATDIRAVCPSMKLVYNGTSNEMALWSNWIGTHGAIPAYMQLGFNLYGSSQTDTTTFQTQVNAVAALSGYISEWNLYFNWSQVTFDQELQKTYLKARYAIIQSSGLDNYFFVWKFQNTAVPTQWNDYSIKYSMGVPSTPGTSWGTRKFADILFIKRPKNVGTSSQSLSFDGTSYASYPNIPSGAGISLMFWYNRQTYSSSEKYVIGNANPSNSYKSAFRLYHDANSRNMVFSTYDDASSQNFLTINSFTGGVWNHIAITITPGSNTATLYINGVVIGTLPGYIGNPTDAIVIGARAGDNAQKNIMNIWDLVIQNTGVAWTQQQIIDHISHRKVPAGASYFDFTTDTNDKSGNGNNLTTTNTTYVSDVDQLYLIPNRNSSIVRAPSIIRSIS